MCLEITRTHSNILTNPDQIREAVDKELESKRNETLRNQEALAIATLYRNKAVYWPAVQDFRGRIYRLGNLNIQSSEFVRSLTALYSDNKPVNRKKISTRNSNLTYCLNIFWKKKT
uniref:DNA-directed RNA polymerase n=1 Tax=Ulva torta TaxID=932731 RepID=A0A7R6NFN4_9CHLO|nr:hypothetical protein JXY92_mgp27 [Ulva torta]AZP40268.1 hypothetical protein [Ulva torta]